jgi:hypothetical protein
VLHTIVFFGASSSQAVHPERARPKDLAAQAAKQVLLDGRNLVLASSKAGGKIAEARHFFQTADNHLKDGRAAESVASVGLALRACAPHASALAQNLQTGFSFLVAASAAQAAGADARDALDMFEAATEARMRADPEAFEPAFARLVESVASCESGTKARVAQVLNLLAAPARSLAVVGGN